MQQTSNAHINVIIVMEKQSEATGMEVAAVCGLYCEACSWFIATNEEPDRLKRLAAELHFSEEESRCSGCRSGKRLPYCQKCKMSACAAQRHINFCNECEEFPCKDLKKFQSAMPHRIELWPNLERIKAVGYQQWLKEIKEHYTCPQCHCINSTYDSKCRNCGHEPSCNYVATHKAAIEQYLKEKTA